MWLVSLALLKIKTKGGRPNPSYLLKLTQEHQGFKAHQGYKITSSPAWET